MIADLIKQQGKNQVAVYVFGAIAVAVVGSIVYFGLVNPILKSVGLKDSAEDKEKEKALEKERKENYWQQTYYENKQNLLTLNAMGANEIADGIYNSWGLFNDDESTITSVFGKIKTKSDLSYVASRYYALHKSDLLTDIEKNMSSKEVLVILKLVNKLK